MTRYILTDEEIKKILDSAITGSVKELFNKEKRVVSLPNGVKVSNGYIVTMTINDSGGVKMRHISVSNPGGFTDPAESDAIATDILGKGYQIIPGVMSPNIFHYLKPESSIGTKAKTSLGTTSLGTKNITKNSETTRKRITEKSNKIK